MFLTAAPPWRCLQVSSGVCASSADGGPVRDGGGRPCSLWSFGEQLVGGEGAFLLAVASVRSMSLALMSLLSSQKNTVVISAASSAPGFGSSGLTLASGLYGILLRL